jgi:hypothetical protein
MMRITLPCLALCASLASATGAAAQMPADTAGIVGSLIEHFDSLHVRSVAPAPYPRGPHDREELLSWTAKVAAAAELDVTEPAVPACPCGRDPLPADAGYMLRLILPVIDGARAEIAVARECDNPEGYVHDVYGVGETYHFERLEGRWQLTSAERRWVT